MQAKGSRTLVLGLGIAACEPASESTLDDEAAGGAAAVRVIDNADWSPVADATLDPFADHAPPDIRCSRSGATLEYDALELSTADCNYFALGAPLLHDVAAGDLLVVRAFHDDLAANLPAVAHLAVAVDGHVIWDEEIDIPTPATPYTVETFADFDAEAGATAVVHLHNHGLNTYRLLDIRVRHTP